jgi:hypothetical protein
MELLCLKDLEISTRLVGAFGLLVVLLLAIGGLSATRVMALEATRRVSSKAWSTSAA